MVLHNENIIDFHVEITFFAVVHFTILIDFFDGLVLKAVMIGFLKLVENSVYLKTF